MLPLDLLLNNLLTLGQDNTYKFKRLYRELYNPNFYKNLKKELYDELKIKNYSEKLIHPKINKIVENLITSLKNQSYHPDNINENIDQEKFLIDNSVQIAISIILETIYKPLLNKYSYGWQKGNSVRFSLETIKSNFYKINWFINGSFEASTIDENILINFLKQRIKDDRFINLIRKFLNSNYLKNWKNNSNLSGVPSGNRLAHILFNIYFNYFDNFIFDVLKKEYKKENKNLFYVRYDNQFLLGIIGSKNDSKEINSKITRFFTKELNVSNNCFKTKIFHFNQPNTFLNYEILIKKDFQKLNNRVILKFPTSKLKEILIKKEVIENNSNKEWKAKDRPYLVNLDDYEIIQIYNSEISKIYEYYSYTHNIKKKMKTLIYFMERSCLKTLAHKHKSTSKQIRKKLTTRKNKWGIKNPITQKTIEFNNDYKY